MTSHQRQTIHSIHNKKFWTEFFYLYESLPALWDVNNPLYKNRQVKGDAYDIMVDKLREIDSTADREDVLRKINIFRTNYRRECSRIALSMQEGRQYKSTLWYFDLLSFLQTADTRRERKRKLLDDGIEKSIMRKRRNVSKHTDTFLVATKKGDIIEYQPHSGHATEMDYDNYDEDDFDYVVEDLSQSLGENKSDSTGIHSVIHMQDEAYQDLDDDGDNSQTGFDDEFKNFALQRNATNASGSGQNSKNDLTAENVGITSTIESNVENDAEDEGSLLIPHSRIQQYSEYSNEASTSHNDTVLQDNGNWGLKSTNMAKNLTMSLPTCINLSTHDAASSTTTQLDGNRMKVASKLVRDVNTMTTNKTNTLGQAGQLSESSEIIAKSWAIQYDEMSQNQKILARKAINDILFDGCMGQLAIGPNGRVTSSSVNYKNQKQPKPTTQDEFESGDIYQQASTTTSTVSLASSIAAVSKTPHEWLKL